MLDKEIREALKLLPTFIKMAENDVDGEEHKIEKPLTYEEYLKVEKLIGKLHTLDRFVSLTIFEE